LQNQNGKETNFSIVEIVFFKVYKMITILSKKITALRFVIMICGLFFAESIVGQIRYVISGSVRDEKNKPIELATVSLNNSLVTRTDHQGNFIFNNVPKGTYTYRVSFIGYETVSGDFEVHTGKERLTVKMKESGLELQNVTVTARQASMGSKSVVGEDAIRHIQPKSVSDLLQLVPGNLTVNPNLNKLSQAYIREIDENDNNALGTSIVLDGTPLSNNANLQSLSPTRYGSASGSQTDGMSDQTTAGRGVDLRTVSAGNIESIEVVRGIPSVEYGNLTSGLVTIKTKSGRTPWEMKVQADPFSKLVFVGKGIGFKDGGAANFSFDWAQSWGDTRKHYLGYDRLTATAGYSKQYGPLSLNIKGSFYSNINNRKNDPQYEEMQLTYTNKNIGGRLSINGSYMSRNTFITKVDYNVSAQVSKTEDKHHNLVSNPDGIITDVREQGIHEAVFKNASYFSDYKIDGLPVNFYAQLVAGKYVQIGNKSYTDIKLGAEYTYDANKGDGLTFDMSNPPQSQGTRTLRPRAYKDIPSLNTVSMFLSDRLSVHSGTMGGQIESGVRISNLFLDQDKSGGLSNMFVMEPRVNASLNILNKNNNALFDNLSLTGGFGISNMMPTLLYLYPDYVYYDNVSLSKYGDNEKDRLALLTTDVIKNTQNSNLRVANSRKWEIGLTFRLGGVKGFFTYFNEHHSHEFGFDSQLYWSSYDKYDVPATATDPKYNAATGDVTYLYQGNVITAAKKQTTDMYTWTMPSNNTRTYKHGVEYELDLGTFKPLRTSLDISGAWFHITRVSENPTLNYINKTYDYVAVMPEGEGTVKDRINTSFRFITHIPAVKMIFTTTAQVVWYESSMSTYEDEDGHDRYHTYTYQGTDYLAVDPIGYYSRDGVYQTWKTNDENDATKNIMVGRYQLYAFEKDVIKPWVLLNFRFTKEIGKTAELSFIANNFANISKWHTNKYSKAKSQIYPDMYFGAELKIKL
jgi:hypothetical protein